MDTLSGDVTAFCVCVLIVHMVDGHSQLTTRNAAKSDSHFIVGVQTQSSYSDFGLRLRTWNSDSELGL